MWTEGIDEHTRPARQRCNAPRRGSPLVVIDLGQVTFLNSVAIGAIVKIARESQNLGADVCLCNASDTVLNVLDTMNLTNLWPHFDSLQGALDSQ